MIRLGLLLTRCDPIHRGLVQCHRGCLFRVNLVHLRLILLGREVLPIDHVPGVGQSIKWDQLKSLKILRLGG